MWDYGMTCCRTPVATQPIIFLGSRRLCAIAVFNASTTCDGQLCLQYSASKIKKEIEGLSSIGYLFLQASYHSFFFALDTVTRAWMTTTVGTPTDVTDPGAIPPTQTRPGSTVTSKFVVGMCACLFVCGGGGCLGNCPAYLVGVFVFGAGECRVTDCTRIYNFLHLKLHNAFSFSG